MAKSDSSVRRYRDAETNDWPDYGVSIPTARNPRPSPLQFMRHIYFDQRRTAELLEHIAATDSGRTMLDNLARTPLVAGTQQQDLRAILSRLIDNAAEPDGGGVVDLHHPSTSTRERSWTELHPDQAIAVRGTVTSGKDIQPSSLRVGIGPVIVRVYVERDHFLHLNQSYLSGLPVTVVGKVRSVPRIEMIAALIGTLAAC